VDRITVWAALQFLKKFDGDKIVEHIESPAMWEQMCFKPGRIK
jgi:hypothetical protein